MKYKIIYHGGSSDSKENEIIVSGRFSGGEWDPDHQNEEGNAGIIRAHKYVNTNLDEKDVRANIFYYENENLYIFAKHNGGHTKMVGYKIIPNGDGYTIIFEEGRYYERKQMNISESTIVSILWDEAPGRGLNESKYQVKDFDINGKSYSYTNSLNIINNTKLINSDLIDNKEYTGHIINEFQNLILSYGDQNLGQQSINRLIQKYESLDAINQREQNNITWSDYYVPIIWNALSSSNDLLLDEIPDHYLTYNNQWENFKEYKVLVEISSELASVPMWNRYAEFILSKKRTDFPKFANELGGVTENISFETLKNLMINELVNENYYEFIYLLAFSKTDRDRLIGLIKAGLIKDNIDYDSQPSYIVDNFFNEEGINFNYLIKYITFFDRDRIGISKINKYLPSINLEINLDLNTNIVTPVLENDWILLKFNRMIKNDGSFDNLTLFEDEKHEIIQRYRKGLFPDNLFNYPKNIKDQFINNLENDFINNEEIDIPIVKKIPDDYNPILELAQKRAQEIREGRL